MKYTCLILFLAAGSQCMDFPADDSWFEGMNDVARSGGQYLEGQVVSPLLLGGSDNDLIVDFMLYTRETRYQPTIVKADFENSLSNFNSTKPFKLVIHGWRNGYDSPLGDILKEAYLDRYDANIMVVDWSSKSYRNYLGSKMSVPKVADVVATMVDILVKRYELRPAWVHIIGHSLGAHIAGIAGLRLPYKIGRVTGLDPAAPLFTLEEEDILKPASADFVDVIHTCGNLLGLIQPLGHADFYPNEGTAIQPGCGIDLKGECSHSRAYELYAESINSKDLLAVRCEDATAFSKSSCSKSSIPMGEHTPLYAHGSYFLKTGGSSPFSVHTRNWRYIFG